MGWSTKLESIGLGAARLRVPPPGGRQPERRMWTDRPPPILRGFWGTELQESEYRYDIEVRDEDEGRAEVELERAGLDYERVPMGFPGWGGRFRFGTRREAMEAREVLRGMGIESREVGAVRPSLEEKVRGEIERLLREGRYAEALVEGVEAVERGIELGKGLEKELGKLAREVLPMAEVGGGARKELLSLGMLLEYYSYAGVDRFQTAHSGSGGGGVIHNEDREVLEAAWQRLVKGLDYPGVYEVAEATGEVREMVGAYVSGTTAPIQGVKRVLGTWPEKPVLGRL